MKTTISLLTVILFLAGCMQPSNKTEMDDTTNTKVEIAQLVNKLFVYTDNLNWDGLKSEVFTEEVNSTLPD